MSGDSLMQPAHFHDDQMVTNNHSIPTLSVTVAHGSWVCWKKQLILRSFLRGVSKNDGVKQDSKKKKVGRCHF